MLSSVSLPGNHKHAWKRGNKRKEEKKKPESRGGKSLKSIPKPDRRLNQMELQSAAVGAADPHPMAPLLPGGSPATFSIVESGRGSAGVGSPAMCCCSAQPRTDGHTADVAAPLCPGSPLAFFFLSPYLFWFVFA